MFCYQCGAELPQGARFCMNCGAKQPENAPQKSAPRPAAAPQPAPVRQESPAGFTLDYTVTRQQIQNGERIYIEDARLPRTVRVKLDSWMEEGTLLSITPGEGNSRFGEFFVRLHVNEAARAQAPAQNRTPPQVPSYPSPQPQTPAYPSPQPQRTAPSYQPAPAAPAYQQPQPAYQPASSAPGAQQMTATDSCVFRLDLPEKMNSFKMGGDDNGNVDVYPDRLEIFKKSKATALAFGAIGSAIEGKGKLFFTLYPAMVRNFQKQLNKKGALHYYLFTLSDGQMLRLMLTGKKTAEPVIDRMFYR